MKSLSKKLALLLASFVVLSSVAGCNKNPAAQTDEVKKSTKGITLTWYLRGNYDSSSPVQSHNEIEGIKALQEKIGIKINFIDVAGASDAQDQQFKLMLASGSYPDIISYVPDAYPGGVPKLYKDGVILKLNDLIDKNVPHLKKFLDVNPNIKKQCETDDGSMLFFPTINPLKTESDRVRVANAGFVIRKDWLDNVGMDVPETLDDWYSVLKAFKDKDPNGNNTSDEIPFDGQGLNMLAPAFGVRTTYYLDPKTNKVAYGPVQPAYKDYLTTMNKWYKEGLFGRYTIVTDTKAVDTQINGDIQGIFKGLDNAWTKYLPNMKKKNPNAALAAVPWPKGPAGKAYTDRTELITNVNREKVYLTTKCSNPEEAAKLFDYCYTDEARDFFTWGIKDKSYTVENGKNKYLPDVTGTNSKQLGKYVSQGGNWPVIDGGAARLSLATPDQLASGTVWGKADSGLILPSEMSLTAEESAKITEINNDMGTYTVDMVNKFITGQEPLTNFDTFVETQKKMGVNDVLKIYQDAYTRYQARK